MIARPPIPFAAVLAVCSSVFASVDYGNIRPAKFAIGSTPQHQGLKEWQDDAIELSQEFPLLTLDYGTEVAGFPIFDVLSLSSPVQLEVKYAEQYPALSEPFSDGPYPFSNGLSDTFRVETFNITAAGNFESFFVQGGQRWETVKLLTNNRVEFQSVGFRATSQHSSIDKLPGRMKTSNDVYNRVFGLGGRAAQVACVDSGNAPSTWDITVDGALVRGQASAQSIAGQEQENYTMSFDTKIVRGGVGWRVASDVQPYGPYFVLTSEYPEHSTFINVNRTLLPPNTLVFNYGWSLVNQSTLTTGWNEYYPLNVSISEGKWFTISTTVEDAGYRIQLDGQTAAFVPVFQAALLTSNRNPYFVFGAGSPYKGSWGFGGFQDQIAYFKNVSVVARNGTEIYRNLMTSNDVLAEYNVATLDHSVCLDGAKRDRLVWIGDFYHTVRIIAHSTARWDYVIGTISYVFSYQLDSGPYAGFVPVSPNLGARPENKNAYTSNYAVLPDYQDLFLAGIGDYFHYTGDVTGLSPYWEKIKKLAEAKLAFIDPYSGLVGNNPNLSSSFNFIGPVNGSAGTGLLAYALQRLTPLAESLNDTATAKLYTKTSSQLRQAINSHLWNEKLGTYSLSVDSPSNFSLTGIAWAILSGAANAKQASSSISMLEELRLGVGYRTYSSEAETPEYQLSPNLSGFLLEALFKSHRDFGVQNASAIEHLLDNLWGSMVDNDEYYSGASWEYVKPDGSPGIDLFTSLAHPWGGAPTYVLPEYLVGVRATEPGYKTFTVMPMVGLLRLEAVNVTVPTPQGSIGVSWTVEGKDALLEVEVSQGLRGVLAFPDGIVHHVDGQRYANETLDLGAGRRTQIKLQLQ
ncbi:Six-hairpin glycosidase [Byssothecium circinans]|uniref:Six-hairpin glycosidase n=1 Tax=Byssothecium circinans TaxID=147558 RepID=A0A6A5TWS4_9PLEO|nr:Six-hairpin glycosidase [Byssothecium circinans]